MGGLWGQQRPQVSPLYSTECRHLTAVNEHLQPYVNLLFTLTLRNQIRAGAFSFFFSLFSFLF